MTEEQARLYFLNHLDEDLDEVWEHHFFEEKQYLLTHTPIQRVWQAKLNKLQKKYQAYMVLTQQEIPQEAASLPSPSPIEFPDNFIAAFNRYQTLRMQLKGKLLQASTVEALKRIVHEWLSMEHDYHNYWRLVATEDNAIKVVRSIEPDPMTILAALQAIVQEKGIEDIRELKENYNNLSEDVQKEVKRLTLLAKDYTPWDNLMN